MPHRAPALGHGAKSHLWIWMTDSGGGSHRAMRRLILYSSADDFDRALKEEAVDPEYLKGLELIRDRILEVFNRAGLAHVEADGVFDPHLHQAVDRATAETDEEDQTILDVYRKGYRFKDRLLRPAMVKVAVKD